jgi:hypothetical protein
VRRYAGDEVREVVVVTESEAPRRRLRRGHADGTVPITRVTVIDASRSDDYEAEDWRGRAASCVARFLSAHRVAAGDPGLPDAASALLVRIGLGTGEQLAAGEWTTAEPLPEPEPRARRRSKHRPGERLAAVMAARDVTLACEELTVRARGDLDARRESEGVLQLESALVTGVAELAGWVDYGDLAERVAELRGLVEGVRAAGTAAREGRLESADVEAAGVALARLEAALRARALYAAE